MEHECVAIAASGTSNSSQHPFLNIFRDETSFEFHAGKSPQNTRKRAAIDRQFELVSKQ